MIPVNSVKKEESDLQIPNNTIQLAMFDLDGTLFDTRQANYMAYCEACGSEFPMTQEFFNQFCMSYSYRKFLPLLGVPEERLLEIHDKKIKCYTDYFHKIRENKALFALIFLLKKEKIPVSLVTTASRSGTCELLKYFGYTGIFDLLVTQESVSRLKPAPDAYQYAMEHFHAEPQKCIIFEDSPVGMQAAKASGAVAFCVSQF